MQILNKNKTLVLHLSVLIWILLASILLFACSSQTYTSAQTDLTPMKTQGDETPVGDLIPLPTPSGSVLPSQQPVALVVTHEGVSIAVTWVYADSARVGIEYRIQGIKVPDGYHLYCPVSAASLKDDAGKEYEKYIWPPAEGPSENFEIQCRQTENGDEYIVTQNYYGVTAGHNQSLGLTLSIDLGGFGIYTKNGVMKEFPANGPFVFHFDVPIIGSLTLDSKITQSKNGMTVTLNRLAINPTLTNAYLCISYDNHKGWYPDITLTWEGKIYQADETATARMDVYHKTFPTFMSQFTTERCYRYSFFVPYQINPSVPSSQQMSITINKMTINAMDALSQDDCAATRKKVQRSYPELNFSCNIDTSDPQGLAAGLNIDNLPLGMDRSTAYGIIEEDFKSIVEGPFIFTVNVP